MFEAALQQGRELLADAAAERLRGMLDRAATVVQKEFDSAKADPRPAMSQMKEMGMFEPGLRVVRLEPPRPRASSATERTEEEDAEMERLTRVLEEKIETAKAISVGKRAG